MDYENTIKTNEIEIENLSQKCKELEIKNEDYTNQMNKIQSDLDKVQKSLEECTQQNQILEKENQDLQARLYRFEQEERELEQKRKIIQSQIKVLRHPNFQEKTESEIFSCPRCGSINIRYLDNNIIGYFCCQICRHAFKAK